MVRILSFEIPSATTALQVEVLLPNAMDAIDEMGRFLGFEHRVTVCRWLIDQLLTAENLKCFSLSVINEYHKSEDLIYPVSIKNARSASGKDL